MFLLSGLLALTVGVCVQDPDKDKAEKLEKAKLKECANNLRQLWVLETVYMSQFGGRMKAMPSDTGSAFWLALTKTTPPLIDDTEFEILVCPFDTEKPRAGFTSYRGPAAKVSTLKGEDPVGCCEPDHHKDRSINVLLKTGEVFCVGPKDALYDKALKGTRGLDPAKDEKPAACRRLLAQLAQAAKAFETDYALYPPTSNAAFVKALSGKGAKKQAYFEFAPGQLNDKGEVLDPWGRPLVYLNARTAGADAKLKHKETFDLYSLGPNGVDDKQEGDDLTYD